MKNKLSDCESVEDIHDYLVRKAENHNYLKIYGKKVHIEYMLQEEAIFLTDAEKWNDTEDKQRFIEGDENKKLFGRCFSFSKSENVAMWMLYARNKEDLMINISPGVIRKSIGRVETIQLGKWNDNNEFSEIISLNKNFEIEFLDIIYYDDVSDKTALRRSTENVENWPRKIIESITYYKKSYPWNYENECRLIVKIPEEVVPKDVNVIKLNIKNMKRYCKVYHNPQDSNCNQYERSSLRGTMNWDL